MPTIDLDPAEYAEIRKRKAEEDLYRLLEVLDAAYGYAPRAAKKDDAKTSPLVKTGLDPNN